MHVIHSKYRKPKGRPRKGGQENSVKARAVAAENKASEKHAVTFQELDGVFGSEPDRDILVTDLPHFKYLECALKETLRMFPPIPMLTREATQDVVLPSGDILPKGVLLAISPLMVHRNPSLYPDPLKFDPQRFASESIKERDPFAYIPFSFGVRGCPGLRYGMMFAKTVAAAVLRRYDVLPDPAGPSLIKDLQLEGTVTLAIRGGARIRLRLHSLSET